MLKLLYNLRLGAILCIIATSLAAKPRLQITSPTDGSLVHPGDTVEISVLASGASFSEVVIVGSEPISFSQILTSPPFGFSIQIPSQIVPGYYTLTASGTISQGNGLESDPISIDVERPDSPSTVTVEPSKLQLSVGDQSGLRVIGKYADGSTVDISRSTQITYAPQSSGIVTVTKDGLVTAIGPGSTEIVVNKKVRVRIIVDKDHK